MREWDGHGIKVEFFASLRESIGRNWLAIPAADAARLTCVEDVRAFAAKELSLAFDCELFARGTRAAVNDEFVDFEDQVKEGDLVAFMPAVTGG